MSQLPTANQYDMPRSEIPVDVLRDILGHVNEAGLATMCLVNKICCSCSQDVLYRDIFVTRSRRKVQQTLAHSTHLARRVRSFESCCDDPNLAMVLRNMTSLRILKLLTGFHMENFDDCTFKLDSFECAYLTNNGESFLKFLSSQPSLKYAKLPVCLGYKVSSLEATCLPNLTRVNAGFQWLPFIIPGRPLNEVISTGSNEHPIDLSFFALSTAPIQKLTIDYSNLCSTPGHLLASLIPSVTHFTLTAGDRTYSLVYEGVCGLPLY
jgi:hypothetical protein